MSYERDCMCEMCELRHLEKRVQALRERQAKADRIYAENLRQDRERRKAAAEAKILELETTIFGS